MINKHVYISGDGYVVGLVYTCVDALLAFAEASIFSSRLGERF